MKLKGHSGVVWFVSGVAATVLLVPTVIGASTVISYMGIVGQSVSPTGAKVSTQVQASPSGQLLVTPAAADSYYLESTYLYGIGTIGTPPASKALIVTSIHVNMSPHNSTEQFFEAWIAKGTSCQLSLVKKVDNVYLNGDAEAVLPYEPGIAIPSGYLLCGTFGSNSGGGQGTATVVGYSVQSNSVHFPG